MANARYPVEVPVVGILAFLFGLGGGILAALGHHGGSAVAVVLSAAGWVTAYRLAP